MTIPDPVRRIGWFVTLWAGGIAGLTAVALPLRWLLKAV
ncbi:DUF2474 family protein [Methylobacterium sp.]|jgi:hypothetical protein|nr:DUF2474 family protein [Methylobacterium sp.]MBY0259171.1 DUF2474 family protein [Methylobacterium sp.]